MSYDPEESLSSPSFHAALQILSDSGSPDFFGLSNTDSQSYTDPSQNSSENSPLQSHMYSNSPSAACPELDFLGDGFDDSVLLRQLGEKLRIVAEPKAFYRERYCSETDPAKHRAQRFIRADDETSRYEYPTVQIPDEWRNSSRDLYIRVTLVTVVSDKVPVVCVHPYTIDTQENGVLRDAPNNSLYFPITREENFVGTKSFRISRKKMIQHDLRSYGPLRVLDLDDYDVARVTNTHDAKQIIDTYHLWQSQLVFTVAERRNNDLLPVPLHFTSVISQIMCDEASNRRKELLVNETLCATTLFEEDVVICTPQRGQWGGGDELLMTIPKLDKRKGFSMYFDYGSARRLSGIKVCIVDTKTIFFRTPPCEVLPGDQNLTVPIVVIQNDLILAHIEFVYLAPNITSTSLRYELSPMNTTNGSNKRRHLVLEPIEFDGVDSLAQQMGQLTTAERAPSSANHAPDSEVKDSKFDKYLTQLQEAVVDFVRTNNPSRLFRRTRLLVAKCEDDPPPLDDAIRHGHIDLALRLIEQSVSMPTGPTGLLERANKDAETPLLLAAKLNLWILIEPILNKRLDLLEKTDQSDNNLLHLLATVSDDKAVETIKSVLAVIPDELKVKLLKRKNKDDQTANELAHSKNNSQCADLLKTS